MGFAITLLLVTVYIVVQNAQTLHSDGHVTGCGCTTTTTCGPSHENPSCPLPRRGKQGPKGNKGEPSETTNEMLTRMEKLETDVQELKAMQDVQLSYPGDCASYHTDTISNERLGRVPVYLENSNDTKMIVANCTKLPEIIQTPIFPYSFPVPKNSLMARTFILEGTIRRPNILWVNFLHVDPLRIFFHLAVRLHIPHAVRDTYDNGRWQSQELDYPGGIPFRYDEPFVMKILTDDVGFHVELDGVHIFTLKHRLRPLADVEKVEVGGRLDITHMSFN